MFKKLAFFLYKTLFFIDFILKKITKRSFLIWFKDFLEEDAYKKISSNVQIKLFTPNYLTNWLADDFFKKEPETIEWIDSFKNFRLKKIIFWDIGSNIGVYSIYAGKKYKNIEVISFEPSTSNLRILSRNISINNLEKKIKIFQIPLGSNQHSFATFRESKFGEGESLNSYAMNLDFEGKKLKVVNKYKIYGSNINQIINDKVVDIPNFVKIDVDGLEHLILKGSSSILKSKKLKSVSIELNENYRKQFREVINIMKKFGFKKIVKKRNENFPLYKYKKFRYIFNYYFERN